MTTPSERVRAIRLGAELLACIHADAGVEPKDRERAADLISRYPDLEKWPVEAEVTAPPPPLDEAEAIFEAGVMFESLARTHRMGRETASLWRTVMRHFPGTQDGCHNPEQVRRLFYPHPFFMPANASSNDKQEGYVQQPQRLSAGEAGSPC